MERWARPVPATILILEDENPLRQAVSKLLRKNDFHVVEAADGSAAIDILRANQSKIDAILLEVTIPGASSPEVVAEAATSGNLLPSKATGLAPPWALSFHPTEPTPRLATSATQACRWSS